MQILKSWEDLGPILDHVLVGELVAIYDQGGVHIREDKLFLFKMPECDNHFSVALLCQPGSDHLELYTARLNGVYFPIYIVSRAACEARKDLSDLLTVPKGSLDLTVEHFHSDDECSVAFGEQDISKLEVVAEYLPYIQAFLKLQATDHR